MDVKSNARKSVGRASKRRVQANALNQGTVARAAPPLAVGSPSGLAEEVRNVNHTLRIRELS